MITQVSDHKAYEDNDEHLSVDQGKSMIIQVGDHKAHADDIDEHQSMGQGRTMKMQQHTAHALPFHYSRGKQG